jgi:hypothetical protein
MKMNLKKTISYLLIAAGFLVYFINLAQAAECHTVYGGGEVCETGDLSLDKKVYNPEAKAYWDNIAASDYTFSVGEEVKFSLRVKNISDVKVDSVRINDDFDRLDEYMVFVSSERGDYRAAVTDHKVKFELGGLNPDEEVTVYFIARFKAEGELPAGTTCLTNAAHAYSHPDNVSDSDYAEFCVKTEAGKIITTKTPDTGLDLQSILLLQGAGFVTLSAYAIRRARKMLGK